jgi:hypothetical protein
LVAAAEKGTNIRSHSDTRSEYGSRTGANVHEGNERSNP